MDRCPTTWWIEPIENAELAFLDIERHAQVVVGGASLIASLGQIPGLVDSIPAELDRRNFVELLPHAADEVGSEFKRAHARTVISLWGALEVMVHDLARAAFMNDPEIRSAPAFRKIKVPLLQFREMDDLDQADFVLRQLEESRGAPLARGAGRFEPLLESVGLGGPVDDNISRAFVEMAAVRNVLVHRGGRADRRFVDECPWLGVAVGDSLSVKTEAAARYFGAAHGYTVGVRQRVTAKYGPR